ncbi:hypothetical protein K438DRAFT_1747244 [Mycena galopus ATCC 62051]|nr:hypothetical protein K438DRAFT_1747244 [Mycena galopus ATCC 62051]
MVPRRGPDGVKAVSVSESEPGDLRPFAYILGGTSLLRGQCYEELAKVVDEMEVEVFLEKTSAWYTAVAKEVMFLPSAVREFVGSEDYAAPLVALEALQEYGTTPAQCVNMCEVLCCALSNPLFILGDGYATGKIRNTSSLRALSLDLDQVPTSPVGYVRTHIDECRNPQLVVHDHGPVADSDAVRAILRSALARDNGNAWGRRFASARTEMEGSRKRKRGKRASVGGAARRPRAAFTLMKRPGPRPGQAEGKALQRRAFADDGRHSPERLGGFLARLGRGDRKALACPRTGWCGLGVVVAQGSERGEAQECDMGWRPCDRTASAGLDRRGKT